MKDSQSRLKNLQMSRETVRQTHRQLNRASETTSQTDTHSDKHTHTHSCHSYRQTDIDRHTGREKDRYVHREVYAGEEDHARPG